MRFLVAIFFCVIAAYGFGFYLSVPANPEVKFWREVVTRREREISDLRAKDPATPILFFTGGSSCAFSIDPKIMEETCGLPAFNLGLPAAAGGRYLLHQALEQTRAGDIMVVCLEPDLLTSSANGEVGSTGASKFSFALAVAGGHPADAAGGDTFGMRPGIRDYLNFSRPGSFHIAVLGAKAFTHKGYRYTSADLRYRGRTETQVRDLAMTPAGTALATCLSTEGRELLTMFKEAAVRRRVHVIYSMPWRYTAEESLAESRSNKRKLIEDIRTIMPASDDGFAGAVSVAAYFSDSGLHLTAQGSAARSRAAAAALKSWLVANHLPR